MMPAVEITESDLALIHEINGKVIQMYQESGLPFHLVIFSLETLTEGWEMVAKKMLEEESN